MEEEEGKLTQVEESGLGRDRWLRGGFSLIPSGINTNTHIQWRYAVFYCHLHKGSHISFCALIFTIRSKSMVIKSRLLTQLEDTWVYINWYFSPNIGDNFINRSFSIPHPIKDILLWDSQENRYLPNEEKVQRFIFERAGAISRKTVQKPKVLRICQNLVAKVLLRKCQNLFCGLFAEISLNMEIVSCAN